MELNEGNVQKLSDVLDKPLDEYSITEILKEIFGEKP